MSHKVFIFELAERLSQEFDIPFKNAELIVRGTRDFFVENINKKIPIQIRGFGSISYANISAYLTRNPLTGEAVLTKNKWVPRFKPSIKTLLILSEDDNVISDVSDAIEDPDIGALEGSS